jgi:alpha-L-fucosidase
MSNDPTRAHPDPASDPPGASPTAGQPGPAEPLGDAGQAPSPEGAPSTGARLDYELLRLIGRGSYGEVWLARDKTGAHRAVKVVFRVSFDHDRPYEREYDGIRKFEPISRSYDHQVQILHVGRQDEQGRFYYIMELADDQRTGQQIDAKTYVPKTLKSELQKRGRLPVAECLRIGAALAAALESLHQHGLIHRDIKPGNIIFVNGVPKLADIGLVTDRDVSVSYVGTEGYIPPEGPSSAQADIYSLGKVLYEMATGRDRMDFPELPTDLQELPDREALLELNGLIVKACEHDARRRYQTARELFADLTRVQRGEPVRRNEVWRRRFVAAGKWAAGAAVAILIAAGVYAVVKRAETFSGGGFVSLFNGRDLTGWRFRDPDPQKRCWNVDHGILSTSFTKGHSTDLVSESSYQDFVLRYEYRINPGANSGVYLRGCYELQINDEVGNTLPPDMGNGALYRIAAPSKSASRPANEWQEVEATVIGERVTVVLNGEKVHDNVLLGEPISKHGGVDRSPEGSGPIVLQSWEGSVAFRNLRIKKLERVAAAPPPSPAPVAEESFVSPFTGRTAWWRNAKFGLILHWGLYAIPADSTTRTGKRASFSDSSWSMAHKQMQVTEYEKFAAQFNPQRFNARDWVSAARNAGARYIVITAKHHDGFCMFGSQQTRFNVVDATPYHRDPMKELTAECQRQGIKLGFYYSIMDWHHPDYLPRRKWDRRSEADADFTRYAAYMNGQVRELLSNYGPVAILWYDMAEGHTASGLQYDQMKPTIRALQPDILVNDRLVEFGPVKSGDFDTKEQSIPAEPLPGDRPWESCMTMGESWGYDRNDRNWKSSAELIRNLCKAVHSGGNFLLNVGPTAEGRFPPECATRLEEIGAWLRDNGEAIYGTTASPLRGLPSTVRCTAKDSRLFLLVFDWPTEGLQLESLPKSVRRARILASGTPLAVTPTPSGTTSPTAIRIARPRQLHPAVTVVELQLAQPSETAAAALKVQDPDWVWLPPGRFTMGKPDSKQNPQSVERSPRSVTLSRGFWIDRFEVTQGEYLAVMGSNPSIFRGGSNRPVEGVTWHDATNYCRRLTERERAAGRLPAGWEYRLPTEAQWEYACRAGTTNQFSYGNDPQYTELGNYAWYAGNSGTRTHAVGGKLPNQWGLYDMHGNVWEWCADWFTSSLPRGSVTDPQGPTSGSDRVPRGGSWRDDAGACQSASRGPNAPSFRGPDLGFRVVLVAVP